MRVVWLAGPLHDGMGAMGSGSAGVDCGDAAARGSGPDAAGGQPMLRRARGATVGYLRAVYRDGRKRCP